AAYNVPVALRIRGPLDLSALQLAFVDTITRHEVLRTVFPADDNGVPYQRILSADEVDEWLDWSVVSGTGGSALDEAMHCAVE
ncbi:hypothetical protein K4H02_26240, partial [Mycobacterium tuberculosis]|nr:hypothetical protein [Mycobacterium tuberculosis]